jgi:hypothetical protein
MLGLLTVILGFSFSMAASLYENRWQLVVTEANTISTAFRRSRVVLSLAHQPFEAQLKAYVDARIEAYDAPFPSERLRVALESAARLQGRLWGDAVQSTRSDRTALEGLFLSALTSMFDAQCERDFSLRRRMPETVYCFIILLASMALAAFDFGRGCKNDPGHWNSAALAVMLGLVFCLINDLDRPRRGIIRIPQDAMVEARKVMDQE